MHGVGDVVRGPVGPCTALGQIWKWIAQDILDLEFLVAIDAVAVVETVTRVDVYGLPEHAADRFALQWAVLRFKGVVCMDLYGDQLLKTQASSAEFRSM